MTLVTGPLRCLAGVLALVGCGGPEPVGVATPTSTEPAPRDTTLSTLAVVGVDPTVTDPMGGSRLTVHGSGFSTPVRVSVGGVDTEQVEVRSDTELVITTPPVPGLGPLDLAVHAEGVTATLEGAVLAWSPAEIAGARLFDAHAGVATEGAAVAYEWQRLTADVAPGWRARDGNTLTWLPSTGRLWMVGGWNPYPEAEGGFDSITTDEVWSSPDGVSWTLELPHLHGGFEPRHSHGVEVWRDRLWMVGGDAWQGYREGTPFYNHDVVSSADGVHWTVELGPGAAAEPPWSERALATIGVHDDRLWMAGGQDLLGDPAAYTYHNDVWVTDDGVSWTQVLADGPPGPTRWEGCGAVNGLVSFRGELWLVGCGRYDEVEGHTLSNEVWSTTDGVTWTRHATPPWAGKIWHDVVVWDDRLWALFGYTYGDAAEGWPAGNANEAWWSEDGETWTALPADAPVPGSHAQGLAVTDEGLVLAGGNYNFGFGAGEDRSVWRLVSFRGQAVGSWTERGADSLRVAALADETRPVLVPDAFGPGASGLHFDGSTSVLSLVEPVVDEQPAGRSVFWVARAPHLPTPWGWEDTYAPVATVVGGTGLPVASVGYTDGALVLRNRDDELGPVGEVTYGRVAVGSGLQEGPGEVRLVGMTHAADGEVVGWIDGAAAGGGVADYGSPRAWSSIGGSLDGAPYGTNARFGGTLGAVVVVPDVLEPETVGRLHDWARGRFGAR